MLRRRSEYRVLSPPHRKRRTRGRDDEDDSDDDDGGGVSDSTIPAEPNASKRTTSTQMQHVYALVGIHLFRTIILLTQD